MNETPYLLFYILVLFPLFFITLWCAILLLLSFASGWRRLAARFQTTKPFRGELARYQSGRLNWVDFSGVLEIGANEQGLYLRPMILFRLFHPSLLIPWSEIEAEPQKGRFFKGNRLTFRAIAGISLNLYGGTFEMMARYLSE